MKIFLVLFLAMVLLSGCTMSTDGEQRQTAVVPTETVPTVTDAITVPEPEPEPIVHAELALFDPFADCVKVEDTVWDELSAAVEEISDWCVTGWGGYAYTTMSGDFCDEDNPLEENKEGEYAYYPVNAKYAKDEEQLYEIVRGAVTENFLTDEELRAELFEEDEYENPPNFKTIDGQLCAKAQYNGVPILAMAKLLAVQSYDGTTAEVVTSGTSVAYPPFRVFMTIVRSEEGVWQLDKYETKDYNPYEAILLYNGLELRQDTLNKILGGGDPLVNPKMITVDGEEYQRCNIDMSIAEMEDFFAETFRENIFYEDALSGENTEGGPLRDAYIKKYIDDVYAEKNGAVYRKCSAPRWYLPEYRVDPYDCVKMWSGNSPESLVVVEQPFSDPVTGEEFSAEIFMYYKRIDENNYDENAPCAYLYIASELPIREFPAEENSGTETM